MNSLQDVVFALAIIAATIYMGTCTFKSEMLQRKTECFKQTQSQECWK